MREQPVATRVDPNRTRRPGSQEGFQSCGAIGMARRHRPVRLVVNAVVTACVIRGRRPAAGAGTGARRLRWVGRERERLRRWLMIDARRPTAALGGTVGPNILTACLSPPRSPRSRPRCHAKKLPGPGTRTPSRKPAAGPGRRPCRSLRPLWSTRKEHHNRLAALPRRSRGGWVWEAKPGPRAVAGTHSEQGLSRAMRHWTSRRHQAISRFAGSPSEHPGSARNRCPG